MAKELSQEEVLDFLCQAGGKVANASLLAHFKHFLRDPQAPAEQLHKRRERFKRYVNSVAVVKPEGAVKYVVLRSRYRDLLGEDLSQPPAPLQPDHQEEDQVPSVPHPAQVRDGRACGQLGTSAQVPHQQGAVLISDVEAVSSKEVSSHPEPSRWTSPAPTHGSTSSCPTSSSASNTPSPKNNGHLLHRSPSIEHETSPSINRPSAHHLQPANTYLSNSKTSSPAINTSSPQNNVTFLHSSPSTDYKTSPSVIRASPHHSQPADIYLSTSKTSLSENNGSSLHSSPSMEYKTSPTVIRASPHHPQPADTYLSMSKTSSSENNGTSLHRSSSIENITSPVIRASANQQQPVNTYLSTSKTSSPSNKSNLSSNQPYNNRPSLDGSLDIPEIPSQVPGEHLKTSPVGQRKTKSTNPAFVNATSRDKEVQKHGCYACTEPQSSNFHLNGTFPPGEHKDYADPVQDDQQMLTLYNQLPPSPPSSRYIDSPRPSPSLQFPHGSSITSADVQLEDYQSASRSPSPPLPLYDIHDMWMSKMPVFKSIRCQLSLQDMEDFVDQESCGSEGSDSGEGADCDTEHNLDEDPSSDSNNDKYVHYIEQKCETTRRCPPGRRFLSINEQYDKFKSSAPNNVKDTLAECGVESAEPILMKTEYSKSPYTTKSFLTDQAPILFALAGNPPRHKMSARMREVMSSSDDELIERDYKKRRRPSRTKRPSNIVLAAPQPDVDLLLTVKPVSSNCFMTYDIQDQKSLHAQYEPKVKTDSVFKKTFSYKPSPVVPLDSMEHDWIIKSAMGSWLHVYGLFMEDPSLALRKDFISGFTAFHWFAKHGVTDMFHKFMAGAKKAGIHLDANVKSNGGYTPLHIAAIHGNHKVAAMLVEKLNVDVRLRDNSGKRAWQYLSCNTSGEVWQLLGAPKGKTIFASRALNITSSTSAQNKSSQINRKTSLAAFLKPQHQKWKASNHPVLREREIYSD
ncbi:ankyrin repeat domain-containing protein SOWAHB [Anomaloglossus baeobatrachus]|uniref:ankyrin repeat domain-containing protein SOWAHB n=1 Tax=Anomaloglossus baeobatrachus TaxID=238106 RepID=UPI003F50AC94